jgi:polyisoprenoid-binding protein YceI
MKGFYVGLILAFLTPPLVAQKYTAEKGIISFFSDGALEDIKAENNIIGSRFNSANGELAYILKIIDFKFPKALMREHFNEKYLESEKFPMSTFNGKVVGFNASAAGSQNVRAVGKLTIHGVTRDVDIPGTIEFAAGKVLVHAKFIVKLEDYKITIPRLVWQNIAEHIEVTVDLTYKPI